MHAIWLGGPLRPTGASKTFWARFSKILWPNEFRAEFILWTDIPRRDFITAASDNPRLADPVYAQDVRAMTDWAKQRNISLVNVHEVFNAHDPMLLHTEFSTETAKHTGPGWAAASDILRLEIVNRFGGLYNDGDNEIQDLTKAFNSTRAGDNGFAANIAWSSKAFTNSGLLAPAHHPFITQALNSIGVNYGLTQKALYEKHDYDLYEREWRNATLINLFSLPARRNSVMMRTGPDAYADVAVKFGLPGARDFPPLSGIVNGMANSWFEENRHLLGPAPLRTRTAQETLQFTAEVVHTMVRSLYNRNGDLHLTAIQDAIGKHQRPETIWKAAFTFIGQEDLRPLVRGATLTRRELNKEGKLHEVSLPEEVRAMLRFQAPEHGKAPVGDSNGWWRGEQSVPVELTARTAFPRHPVGKRFPRPSDLSSSPGAAGAGSRRRSSGMPRNPLPASATPRSRITAAPAPRDLTWTSHRPPVDTQSVFVAHEASPGSGIHKVTQKAAPWAASRQRPHIIVATAPAEHISMIDAMGSHAKMTPRQFAIHVEKNLIPVHSNTGVPLVLVMAADQDRNNLMIPRLLANQTGRTVFYSTGPVRLLESPDKQSSLLSQFAYDDKSRPSGSWVKILPGDPGSHTDTNPRPTPPAYITTIDGQVVADRDVATNIMVNSQNRPIGFDSSEQAEWADDEAAETPQFIANRQEFSQALEFDDRLYEVRDSKRAFPWSDGWMNSPYFVSAHGTEGHIKLHLTDDSFIRVDGEQFGRFLKRRPSFTLMSPARSVVLVSCRTGARNRPDVFAQLVADVTGRRIFAPSADASDQLDVLPDPNGAPGEWRSFLPRTGTARNYLEQSSATPRRRAGSHLHRSRH
ncbi:hypothetical protein ACWGJX_45855 [Streptomyces sp. NPDC054775]